jgi:DnaJ-class molecular chaperone
VNIRWLIVFVIASIGCVASLPTDPGISADLAVETARMVIANRAAPPAPKPDAGKCSNCNGTGKIGDGRIVMTCPECNGTGKPLKSVLHPAVFVPCKECDL